MAILTEHIRYEVTIKRISTISFDSKTDSLTEERHYTDKEREESYTRWEKDNEYTKKIYTQVPSVGTKSDSEVIFSQIVAHDIFDIKKVIGAINDLK